METSQKTRILLVEDCPALARVTRFTLEHAGFCVTVAVDGMDALEKAQNDQFDLIVSDEQMPRMNGRQLCLQLRDDPRYAETPIIFVTAKKIEIESDIMDSFGSETAVIGKPFSPSSLLRTVEAKLGLSPVV